MGRLTQYFFSSLPDYFFLYDSYKRGDLVDPLLPYDIPDRKYGILERYLAVFQEDAEKIEMDIRGEAKVAGLANLPFPETTIGKHLSFIASLFGYPPDVPTEHFYRLLLRNIMDINKVRGTPTGFDRFFGILGVKVEVKSRWLPSINYDTPVKYDTPDVFYDSTCFPCAWVTITITEDPHGLFDPGSGYTLNQKKRIQSILQYLLPINAIVDEASRLDAWIYLGGGPQNIQIQPTNLAENLIKFKRIQ